MPERFSGVGLGAVAACVVAEEAGRSLAPIPLIQPLVTTEALLALGTEAQQARWLPGIADGSVVAVAGWAEGTAASLAVALARYHRGTVSGTKTPVAGAAAARVAVVSGTDSAGVGLYPFDLAAPGVAVATLDLVRPHAAITLTAASAEPLGDAGGPPRPLDRAAVITAFEALGVAAAAMAVAYAKERVAFGCQFYYRRSRALVAALGSRSFWAERLVRSLEQRNAVAA